MMPRMSIEAIKDQVRADIERHIDTQGLVGQQTPEQIAAAKASMEDWLSVRWSALLGRRVVVTLVMDESRANISFGDA